MAMGCSRFVLARLVLVALIAAALAPRGALGDDAGRWAFSVHFENDLFADTDRNYTNGLKLTAVSPDLTSAFDSLVNESRNASALP